MDLFVISRKDGIGETLTVDVAKLTEACEKLSEGGKHPLNVTRNAAPAPREPAQPPTAEEIADAPAVVDLPVVAPSKGFSSFAGPKIVDDSARARIEAQHTALAAAGAAVNTKEQLYGTGTRLAQVGYDTQACRAREHAAKKSVRDIAHEIATEIGQEGREDIVVSAGELGRALHCNGRISFDGLAIGEQAIRGLSARLESPMLGYVLGLRDRIAASRRITATEPDRLPAIDAQVRADRACIAEVMRHECLANPDVQLKLRGRRGLGDVYAVVSPSYEPADAPSVVAELVDAMPADARGTFSYDPGSTAWELRASVWTPTPVEEQAVGEPFEGYATFQSRDNGTSRFRGGGGATLLRCLNASTYTAEAGSLSRVHRRGVRSDIADMIVKARGAIDALCAAWGVNREAVLETPKGVPISAAIPGFWRFCLQSKKSELAGVLPGRTEEHVKGLTAAFFDERRDRSRLVRADLAQGWTRYIQEQPAPVRREAEIAIGDWLVRARPLGCDLKVD